VASRDLRALARASLVGGSGKTRSDISVAVREDGSKWKRYNEWVALQINNIAANSVAIQTPVSPVSLAASGSKPGC